MGNAMRKQGKGVYQINKVGGRFANPIPPVPPTCDNAFEKLATIGLRLSFLPLSPHSLLSGAGTVTIVALALGRQRGVGGEGGHLLRGRRAVLSLVPPHEVYLTVEVSVWQVVHLIPRVGPNLGARGAHLLLELLDVLNLLLVRHRTVLSRVGLRLADRLAAEGRGLEHRVGVGGVDESLYLGVALAGEKALPLAGLGLLLKIDETFVARLLEYFSEVAAALQNHPAVALARRPQAVNVRRLLAKEDLKDEIAGNAANVARHSLQAEALLGGEGEALGDGLLGPVLHLSADILIAHGGVDALLEQPIKRPAEHSRCLLFVVVIDWCAYCFVQTKNVPFFGWLCCVCGCV